MIRKLKQKRKKIYLQDKKNGQRQWTFCVLVLPIFGCFVSTPMGHLCYCDFILARKICSKSNIFNSFTKRIWNLYQYRGWMWKVEFHLLKLAFFILNYCSKWNWIFSAPIVVSHLFLGHLVSVKKKSLLSLSVICLVFVTMAVLAWIELSQDLFMILSLVQIAFINIFRSLFRASTSVNMGKFPVEYMSALSKKTKLKTFLSISTPRSDCILTEFWLHFDWYLAAFWLHF